MGLRLQDPCKSYTTAARRPRTSSTSSRRGRPSSICLYVLEILAQVLVLVTLARRLPQKWLAFVDNVAGQWALTKRYGKDPTVNGELVAFWSTAALADCSSCAVEGQCPQRRDLEMARRMGWTRGNTPVKGILQTLARAVIRTWTSPLTTLQTNW